MALILINWTIGGNVSTSALSQQSLSKLGWGYSNQKTVLMNGSHWESVRVKVGVYRPLYAFDTRYMTQTQL